MNRRNNIATWFNAIACRLRDMRGFMLAEQLVSIIFIGLLCIAVAAGLQAAMSSYAKITRQTQADAMLSNAVEAVSDELVYALDVESGGAQSDQNPLYFTSATRHETAAVQTNERGIWLNAAGERALLAASEGDMTPSLVSLAYDADGKTWTFKIAVDTDSSTLAETTMTVKRIGT